MASNGINITKRAFQGVCGTLFGLAIIAAIARTLIRFRISPRFALDDALLLFACICLTAATGLLYKIIPNLYLYELGSGNSVLQPNHAEELVVTVREVDAYVAISWLVVFAVKFCFLSFFRALIDRLQPMIIYWRIVVFLTVIFGTISLCETFIACPRIGTSSMTCLQDHGSSRTFPTAIAIRCLDIIADILLITIPISLLWNFRAKTREKVGVGTFLCLSIVMIIVSIIQASGLRTPAGFINQIWVAFWQQVEACVAVIMFSFLAFRSVYISNKRKAETNNAQLSIFHHSRFRLSSMEASRGDVQHLSLSTQGEQKPPYVALSGPFESIQQKEYLESQAPDVAQGTSSSYPQDPESGSQRVSKDSGPLITQNSSTETSAVTDCGSCEHQPEKELVSSSDSQDRELSYRRRWSQMGVISDLMLSRSRAGDSEV